MFPVSGFHSPPGAFGWKRFEVSASPISLRGLQGLPGADESAQEVAGGLGAQLSSVANPAVRNGLSGLGENGLDALARILCVRREGWGLRFGDLPGASLWRGCDLELEIVPVGCDTVVGVSVSGCHGRSHPRAIRWPRNRRGPEQLPVPTDGRRASDRDIEFGAVPLGLVIRSVEHAA